MEIFKFLDWEFLVDKESTLIGYEKVKEGGSSSCRCAMCENFNCYRTYVWPIPIKSLFADLGIDYTKDAEAAHYARLDNGLHQYGGWFHFVGKIIEKAVTTLTIEKPIDHTLTDITDNFSIGFHKGSARTLFDENILDLVQVEFVVNIPWVIEKEKEPV